jgi:hypothetical protein
MTNRGNPFKIAVVGCSFNPSHLPPERTLPLSRPIRIAERARRAAVAFSLLLSIASCRDTFAGFGVGARARVGSDQMFGALGERFTEVARNAKYEYARIQITHDALVPSRVFRDSAAWTRSSGNVRLLETQGAFSDGRYLLASHGNVPAPRDPADGRHITTLSRLSDSEYRWDTTVDFAIGSARPSDVATVFSRLVASAEGRSERDARVDLRAVAPHTSSALGTAFSIDSLHPTLLADGTTAVTLVIAVRSELLKRRYPAFGEYVRRYIDPTRYRFVIADRAGIPYIEASQRDRLLTIRVRTLRGQIVPLAGPVRPMPDTLALLVDFTAKIKHLTVGFHGLSMELVHVRGDSHNEWAVTAHKEPQWDLPFASAHLIRAPLRRPFAGEGSLFRLGLRTDGNGPTVIVRQSRLFVQESAILRFLNSLGNTAMDDFESKVEREENAWLRDLFLAMREDARLAIAP